MRGQRVKEGLCADCGKKRGFGASDYRCKACADQHTNQERERRKLPGYPDPLLKPPDPARIARNVKKMRRKRVTDDLCVDCGNRRGYNGTNTRCRSCADEHADKQRKRREQERDPFGILAAQEEAWQREQEERIKDSGLTPIVIKKPARPD